jgi:HK97 family phage prohead protease
VAEKYSDDEKKDALAKGHAMPNENGDPSYPIKDQEDLEKAIAAVGRGGVDHDKIRAFVMKRAEALGLSKMIPDTWNADGSLKGQSNSAKKPHHRSGLPQLPEVRHFSAMGLEVRTGEDGTGDTVTVTGTPIVYNAPYVVVDMFGEFEERMSPGVARSSMNNSDDVRFLFDHEGLPLARTASGTLKLSDTNNALQFRATLDLRQQLSNDLMIAIERGDISQMSCGFSVASDDWSEDFSQRTVNQFRKMYDVSAVTYPASPTTSIEIAQRMVTGVPIESRSRIWAIEREIRAGKVLSQANSDALVGALSALHQASDALAVVAPSHQTAMGHLGNVLASAEPEGSGEPDGDENANSGESVYEGNADGSNEGSVSGDPPVLADGSGSRSAKLLQLEADLVAFGVRK